LVSEPRFDMAEKDMKALADRMERMAKRMEELLAAYGIKLQPTHAEDPSCPEVTRAEEQTTKETLPSPLANPPGQQLTKTIATPKTNPPAHPLPKPTAPPQIDPAVQSLPKTTSPPPCKDPKPISSQKEDQPPSSAQTPPQKLSSSATPTIASPQTRHKPHMLASPSPNTHSPLNPHKASPPLIKPSPPKIPLKNQTKPTKHNANPHSRFFGLCRNTPSLAVALLLGARGKKRRACDWFRRRKRARYKPSCVADRRNATKIKGELAEFLALGVKVSGRGKEDQGFGATPGAP
jgi:hypothetical protein